MAKRRTTKRNDVSDLFAFTRCEGGAELERVCQGVDVPCELTLPETVDLMDDDGRVIELPLVKIGVGAFAECATLVEIALPKTLTEIGDFAFWGCVSLKSILMSERLTQLGVSAFAECSSLETVFAPGDLEFFGARAFDGCSALRSIELRGTFDRIDNGTFRRCSSLESIKLPDSITRIGARAFEGCSALRSIELPDSVVQIGESAFRNCSALSSLELPDALTRIPNRAFQGCSSLYGVAFPTALLSIDSRAFYDCSSMKSVVLPKNLTQIGRDAFGGCESVYYVQFPESLEKVDADSFEFSQVDLTVAFPERLKDQVLKAFPENAIFQIVGSADVGTDAALLASRLFQFQTYREGATLVCALSGVELPSELEIPEWALVKEWGGGVSKRRVVKINRWAFENRREIKSVVLPKSLRIIESSAFIGCDALSSISMPSELESIGHLAFAGCAALKKIVLPEKLNSLGVSPFRECDSLESIEISNANALFSTESGVLFDNKRDALLRYPPAARETSYAIPQSVKTIEDGAFRGAANLVYAEAPNVETIGSQAFQNCSRLSSVHVSHKLKTIGDDAFDGCAALKSIVIPLSTTLCGKNPIPKGAEIVRASFGENPNPSAITVDHPLFEFQRFEEGVALVGVKRDVKLSGRIALPEKVLAADYYGRASELDVVKIGDKALYNNDRITAVVLPSKLRIVGKNAFEACDGLIRVEFSPSLTRIEKSAFLQCRSLCSIDLPSSLEEIEDFAFTACSRITSAEIPSSVKKLGSAFPNCSSLTRVDLPDTIEEIGAGIFSGCASLASIRLPRRLRSIPERAFKDCQTLSEIEIPDTVTSIGENAFKSCRSISAVKLGASIKSVDKFAFDECSSLHEILIPEKCSKRVEDALPKSIRIIRTPTSGARSKSHSRRRSSSPFVESPFDNPVYKFRRVEKGSELIGFRRLYALPRRIVIPAKVGYKTRNGRRVELPVVSVARGALAVNTSYETVVFPPTVRELGAEFCACARSLRKVVLPSSIKRIPERAFWRCLLLRVFEAPLELEEVAELAFESRSSLTSLSLPDSTTRIGARAIPSRVKILRDERFSGTDRDGNASLFEYRRRDGGAELAGVVASARNNESFVAPETIVARNAEGREEEIPVVSVGPGAFMNCARLTTIVLPSTVRTIGREAFSGCKRLAQVRFPDALTTIGYAAFYKCRALKFVDLPREVETIQEFAFMGCDDLSSVKFPYGLETIGDFAFYDCNSLVRVEVPPYLANIGEKAFPCKTIVGRAPFEKSSIPRVLRLL